MLITPLSYQVGYTFTLRLSAVKICLRFNLFKLLEIVSSKSETLRIRSSELLTLGNDKLTETFISEVALPPVSSLTIFLIKGSGDTISGLPVSATVASVGLVNKAPICADDIGVN